MVIGCLLLAGLALLVLTLLLSGGQCGVFVFP